MITFSKRFISDRVTAGLKHILEYGVCAVGIYLGRNISVSRGTMHTEIHTLVNTGIRLHNVFVFRNGHCVRLGNRDAINSYHVLVGRLEPD